MCRVGYNWAERNHSKGQSLAHGHNRGGWLNILARADCARDAPRRAPLLRNSRCLCESGIRTNQPALGQPQCLKLPNTPHNLSRLRFARFCLSVSNSPVNAVAESPPFDLSSAGSRQFSAAMTSYSRPTLRLTVIRGFCTLCAPSVRPIPPLPCDQ